MQVNLKMLNNILEEEDDCFVFFYENNDPEAYAILAELEGMYSLYCTCLYIVRVQYVCKYLYMYIQYVCTVCVCVCNYMYCTVCVCVIICTVCVCVL